MTGSPAWIRMIARADVGEVGLGVGGFDRVSTFGVGLGVVGAFLHEGAHDGSC